MEKQQFKRTLSKGIIPLLIATIGLSSCKKETNKLLEPFNKPAQFNTEKEAGAYVNKQLRTYTVVFAELAKKPAIINLVHEEVSKKFDGDNNVLIKTLLENAQGKESI